MRFTTTTLFSTLLALAAAYTTPDYSQPPSGNAILKPGLGELVPVGKPYTITWEPTTEGQISLVLLRGPSTNVVPIETLAENIPNDGEYSWTPSAELEPDTSRYGLLLVVESEPNKGQYQYSTQFGIRNPDFVGGEESSSSAAPTSTSVTVTSSSSSSAAPTSTTTAETETETETETTSEAPTTTTTPASMTITTMTTTTNPAPTTTGGGDDTNTDNQDQDQDQDQEPSSTPAPPDHTGAAHRNAISLGAVAAGVAAVFAF
ncbi:Ser-Thr-rich glycosyl-phosphatidyl-inositol-anchored membrane family-domain-containing protein [Aspergillus egyptiacus]|nr:Ser-Thr-rich glycosyl-phosphatidyl-inositol-anchored membrane family-domain-containing protein [Aspergillus egyptiacus]